MLDGSTGVVSTGAEGLGYSQAARTASNESLASMLSFKGFNKLLLEVSSKNGPTLLLN